MEESLNDGAEAQPGLQDENINISDVIEVIQTDPDFNPKDGGMFSGGSHTTMPSSTSVSRPRNLPKVVIVEQPAAKALRFRYECEGRSAGSIPGENSTPENKTFPSIRIEGYKGRAVVVVSCVTKDRPYRPHPHNLVGRDGCKRGVCTLEVSSETMSVTFSNLGIQCVKKKDIENALRVREEIRVDPFRTGFSHRNTPTAIDLNAVRLCFQVFIEGREKNKFTVPLDPVVSVPIFDKKAMSELTIVKLSDCVSSVDGGRKDIILLCEKVAKEDIQIRFYEENNGEVVWEGFGDFQPSQVHKQSAIWFRAPRYKTLEITEPVKVFIQLRRPSDGQTSDPLPFEFLPLDSEARIYTSKKRKMQNYELDDKTQAVFQQLHQETIPSMNNPYLMIPVDVKTEPRESASSPYLAQGYGGISPMYVQNCSVSPNVDPTLLQMNQPQPQTSTNYNIPQNMEFSVGGANLKQPLPPIDTMGLGRNWNMVPNQQEYAVNNNIPMDASNLLFDLDTNTIEEIKSGDIREALDISNNLSESFTNNLSLSDMPGGNNNMVLSLTDNANAGNNNNMTDSLTRLANSTIDDIIKLNEMYK